MDPNSIVFRNVAAPMRGKVRRYPVESMRVHDTFFIPLEGRTPESITSSIYTAVRRLKARYPQVDFDFIVRRVRENGVNGIRCWRLR